MAIVRRNLTVHFQRSVTLTSTDVVTQSVEVSVIPLQDASNAAAIATFVGGIQSLTIPLANEDNPAVFSLVPSNAPGLTNAINYRIMWRIGGVTGRTQTYDFAMPDADISFDEIQSIGNVITGQAYLLQTDLGVVGRVARLNDLGEVVDAFGVPVASGTDLATIQARVTTEITNRLTQDQARQEAIQAEFQSQIGYVSSTAAASLSSAVTGLNSAISSEATARTSADTTLTTNLNSLQSTVTNNAQSASTSIAAINTALGVKADLVGGKIPIGQIPDAAITSWIPLTSAADRLTLSYPSQVQLGDVVLTPTGVYGLVSADPSNPSSWYLLNQVLSVNGYTGSIVLNPNDVGVTTGSSGSRVIASGITIPQAQVTSLVSDLALKAPLTTTASLQTQIDVIKNDTGYVKVNGSGVINTSLLDSNVALINNLNQVVKKDGTVIGSGGGGSVFSVNNQTGVVNITTTTLGAVSTGALTTALATKADLVSSKVPVAQIPTGIPQDNITNLIADLATKATLVNGKVPQANVEGLSAIISNNALTSTSNLSGRVYILEQTGGSGGSGGGTASTKSVFWGGTGVADTTNVTDLNSVKLFSPFGITSGGVRYYRGAGVPDADVAFPVITTGGHLQLNKWNESNAPDPVYALASDLTTLSGSLTALSSTVSGKASTTSVATLSDTVNNKADKVNGFVPVAQIPTGIAQSNITNLTSDLAARATLTNGVLTSAQIPVIPQASVTNLVTDLAAKAPLVGGKVPVANIPLLIPQANVENLTAALSAKAPLVSNLVPVVNIPTGIPQANITNLTTDLAARATLTNGVLTASQIPTGIAQSNITNLTTDLAARATLTNGVLTSSQIPFEATQHPKVFITAGALASRDALTFSDVSLGDQCIITGTAPPTADVGTYTVVGTNITTGKPVWQKHPGSSGTATGAVLSITGIKNDGSTLNATPNGSGVLTLQASDIGAQPFGSYVTTSSLATSLGIYYTKTQTDAALAAAVLNPTQVTSVNNIVRTSSPIRGRVDYVCTISLPAISGSPQIGFDTSGTTPLLAQNGSRILLTNQTAGGGKRDNGIWVVNTAGPWTRPTDDYNTGQTVLPNTVVLVSCRSALPAAATNYTLWQCTNTAPIIIGDGETSWGDANGSPAPYGYLSQPVKLTTATGTAGNGITVGGSYPNVTLGQTVSTGGGLIQTATGPAIDTSKVVRKYSTSIVVGSGGGTQTVQHDLAIGSNVAPFVSVMDFASGWSVLVGWKKNVLNPTTKIDLEFGASVSGTYLVTVMG